MDIPAIPAYQRLAQAVFRSASAPPSSSGLGVEAVSPEVDRADSAGAVRQLCEAFVGSVRWRVVVPGEHSPGVSAQGLLEDLKRRGKDLLSEQGVRPKIAAAVLGAFGSGSVVPSRGALNAAAARVILEEVVSRFHHGFGEQSGHLKEMVARDGRVEFLA